MRRIALPRPEPGEVFASCVALLLGAGVVAVFSAGAFHWSVDGDVYYFLRRQVLWVALAVLVGILTYELDHRFFQRFHWLFLAASCLLLALVLIPQLGRVVNQSRRWLPLGGGLQIQPSELGKLAVIVFIAARYGGDDRSRRSFWRAFAPSIGAVLAVMGLVLAEPDLGTAVFIALVAGVMLCLAGARWYHLAGGAAFVAPLVALAAWQRWETVQTRLAGMLEPERLYQVQQSLIALGSGGLTGAGLGAGLQKLRYLPEAHTDFILAVIGEELGFMGTSFIVLVFVVLIWAGGGIALRARDRYGYLLASGITAALGLQAMMNVAVISAAAPTKGIPLPFVSFGGSGLCTTMAAVGLLLSVAREERFTRSTLSSGPEADSGSRGEDVSGAGGTSMATPASERATG